MGGRTMGIKNRADFVVPPLVKSNMSRDALGGIFRRTQFLALLCQRYDWTHGAELGLWEGRTISALLGTCPKLHMIGVDLWCAQPGNPGPEGYEGWDHDEHERRARRRCAQFEDRARIIKGHTVEAARHVEDASLDFVFIDADHSEAGCRADIAAWLPKIRPGGWITGHDINWPGVRAAVEDLVPGYLIGPDVVWCRPVNPAPDWQAEWL
jgi:hypothetical protein